ncbi:MAG: glycosyltransferase family 4 protein [Alphaproteobacteria bacterium]|nr:glycosyltransferase family 4 protein [Alphaproteobacteria bacterium]
MKIGVLGDILSYDGRGIARATSFLFSNINRLFPDLELNLLSNKPLINKFADNYLTISPAPNHVAKYALDYLICPWGHWHPSGIIAYKKSCPNTKLITFIHDIIPMLISDDGDRLSPSPTVANINYKNFIQAIIDNTDIILVSSEYTKHDLIHHLDMKRKNIYTIPFSHMLEKPTILGYNPYSFPFFLYNGGYDYRKGVSHILDNFLQLKLREKIVANLVLTGTYHSLNQRTDFLINYGKNKGWVCETGYISDEELANLFSNAVALLYPSLYEGFGLPPLEAMHLDCPVITTRSSSIPEVCGDAAYYIDRENEDEFQQVFIDLENNADLRNQLIVKGKENIKRFSWEKSASKLVDILKQNLTK